MKTFSEKVLELRRREGLSQEQLADRLGVTRQSVSKWESGAAVPELGKLIALSEMFSVSVDYLVKDRLEEPERPAEVSASNARLEERVEEISRYVQGWRCAWDSRIKVFGLPLVSIRFHFAPHMLRARDTAKGIVALGNVAVGIISVGFMSVGIFSLGAISVGILTLGALACGLAALGPVAIGLLAVGPVAIGRYAGGVTALADRIAVGVAAVGKTAIGYDAAGEHVLLWGDGLTRAEAEAFLLEHHPKLWKPLLDLLATLGANIK